MHRWTLTHPGLRVKDLDQTAVQTLHSFAASLLRELPLEAGLPPTFETLDEIRADLLFQEAWDQLTPFQITSQETCGESVTEVLRTR